MPNSHDLLRKYRPVRYDHGDTSFMTKAIDAREKEIKADSAQVQRLARERAEDDVKRMEEQDTRLAHQLLRDIGRTGQPPLSISLTGLGACPLKIGEKEKFRLEVATSSDLERWELQRRRDNDAKTQKMIWETGGASQVVSWMQGQGAATFGAINWGQVPITGHQPDEPDDDE